MVLTNILPDQFISETKRFGITADSLIRVDAMRKGDFLYFKIAIPNTTKEIQTRIPIADYEKFEFMNLAAISIPAVWNPDIYETDRLIRKLEELNANPIAPDRYYSTWNR